MAILKVCAYLPAKRNVTEKDREIFDTISFDPLELIQLKEMNKEELKGLMAFCGIRMFRDTPVIACTEEEMRLAYLGWRAYRSLETRKVVLNKTREWLSRFDKTHTSFLRYLDI